MGVSPSTLLPFLINIFKVKNNWLLRHILVKSPSKVFVIALYYFQTRPSCQLKVKATKDKLTAKITAKITAKLLSKLHTPNMIAASMNMAANTKL
jgi:hypothetical protein